MFSIVTPRLLFFPPRGTSSLSRKITRKWHGVFLKGRFKKKKKSKQPKSCCGISRKCCGNLKKILLHVFKVASRPIFWHLFFKPQCKIYLMIYIYRTEGVIFKIKSNSGQCLFKNTEKVVKSQKRTPTMSLVAISSSLFGPFLLLYFSFLRKRGRRLKELFSPSNSGSV